MVYYLIITGGVKTWKKMLIRAWPHRLQPGKRMTDVGQRGKGAETRRQGLAQLVGTPPVLFLPCFCSYCGKEKLLRMHFK